MYSTTKSDRRRILRVGTLREELRAIRLFLHCGDIQTMPRAEKWLAARAMAMPSRRADR